MKHLRLLLLLAPLAAAQTITTTSPLTTGAVGDPYSVSLACSNCSGQQTWAMSGNPPPGLGINIDTGAISGTPTSAGTFSFAVVLTVVGLGEATKPFSVVINSKLAVTSTTLPNATLGVAYSQALAASGGIPPYTWSGKVAIPGLSLVNGVLQGTPTTTGTYTFTAVVVDADEAAANATVTLTITGTPLTFPVSTLPSGFKGVAYTYTFSATGGAPPYTWSLGTLSDGLTIDASTGILSGTPTAAGQFTLNVTVTDSATTAISRGFTLNVLTPLTVTTTALANGSVGVAYSQTLAATGGQSPYTWSIPAASMPPGLTLNASTGVISGSPTATGLYSLTATVTDSQSNTASAKLSISVTNGVTISPSTLPAGTVGTSYSQQLTAAGGTAPYTWSVAAGSLPTGLSLSSTSGALTGIPAIAGTYSFTAQAADAAGLIGQARYSVTIANPPLTVTTTSLPGGVVGAAYSQVLIATGGTSSYTWSLASGTLPAGLQLAAVTGAITGTPTAAGTSAFTVQVTDSSGATAQGRLSIAVVTTPLTVTTASLPQGTVGLAYSQTLAASGGAAPYTWSISEPALPAGLTLAATGAITGTPTAAGSSTFTVSVKDSSGTVVGKTLSIAIVAPVPPVITITGAPATTGFQQQLPVTMQIGSPYPSNITGTVVLTFTPSVTPSAGVDDGMIQFSSGGRTINFTIPAGQTIPTLTGASGITVLTGTTAGTITLTATLQDANGNTLGVTENTIITSPGVPFISSVTFQQVTGGVTVTVVGFSSTRDMVSGSFTFAPATNVTFSDPAVTVPLTSAFTTWWNNTAQSNPYGTQFTLTMPFSTSTQSVSVVSVAVTLTNSKGTSTSVVPAQ